MISEKEIKVAKAICESTITIGNIELKCVVLDNGQRVIEEQSFFDFFQAMADGTLELNEDNLKKIGEFVHGK